MRFGSGCNRRQRLLQICFEIVRIFESSIEAHDTGTVGRAFGRVQVIAHDQAADTTPAIADLEKLERINEPLNLLLTEALMEHDGKQASGTGEVALP